MLTSVVSFVSVNSVAYGLCVLTQQHVHGMSYSKFMGQLSKSGIELNRKVLADLAMNHPEAFKAVVDKIK